MFEFKKPLKLIIELNNAMSHYNLICKRLREKKNNRKMKQQNFKQNPNYTNLIFPNYTADGFFLMRLVNAKFKNQSSVFHSNNFKSLKSLDFTEINLDKFIKKT